MQRTGKAALAYSGVPLERDAGTRSESARLERYIAAPETTAVVLSGQLCFVPHEGDSARVAFAGVRSSHPASPAPVFLGKDERGAVFALEIGKDDEQMLAVLRDRGELVELRDAARRLPASEAALLGYARALSYWNHNYRFCSRCGAPTESARGGHVRSCTSSACGREHFPHINPAVIMLVTNATHADGIERCLLARHVGRISAVFSTLAGFVEPGESLEEAVAREVREEAGVTVSGVRYQGSQPWPFPAQLMLGFRAVAPSHELRLDPAELEDARWFTRDEVRRAGDWGDETAAMWIPRADSISRYLIDTWLDEEPAATAS